MASIPEKTAAAGAGTDARPFKKCSACGISYPTEQSWLNATRTLFTIADDGTRTPVKDIRLCPCGCPLLKV